jgi:hypothetical protein
VTTLAAAAVAWPMLPSSVLQAALADLEVTEAVFELEAIDAPGWRDGSWCGSGCISTLALLDGIIAGVGLGYIFF